MAGSVLVHVCFNTKSGMVVCTLQATFGLARMIVFVFACCFILDEGDEWLVVCQLMCAYIPNKEWWCVHCTLHSGWLGL